MIAYLSGAMENAPHEGQEWRGEITEWLKYNLNHQVIDPILISRTTAIKENAQEYKLWKSVHPEKYKSFIRKIIHSDIDAVISKVDYIICLWDEYVIKGGGTHAEVTFGYWYHKPVFLINKLEKVALSSWIEACSDSVFDDFQSLQIYLLNLYKSNQN